MRGFSYFNMTISVSLFIGLRVRNNLYYAQILSPLILCFLLKLVYNKLGIHTLFKNKIDIDSEALAAIYLSGGQLDAPSQMKGFTAVLYKGSPLGGGKASSGRVNNHYPKGLRIQNI